MARERSAYFSPDSGINGDKPLRMHTFKARIKGHSSNVCGRIARAARIGELTQSNRHARKHPDLEHSVAARSTVPGGHGRDRAGPRCESGPGRRRRRQRRRASPPSLRTAWWGKARRCPSLTCSAVKTMRYGGRKGEQVAPDDAVHDRHGALLGAAIYDILDRV